LHTGQVLVVVEWGGLRNARDRIVGMWVMFGFQRGDVYKSCSAFDATLAIPYTFRPTSRKYVRLLV
jgi:hypothetical protein